MKYAILPLLWTLIFGAAAWYEAGKAVEHMEQARGVMDGQ